MLSQTTSKSWSSTRSLVELHWASATHSESGTELHCHTRGNKHEEVQVTPVTDPQDGPKTSAIERYTFTSQYRISRAFVQRSGIERSAPS
jgi:hypothetical protein